MVFHSACRRRISAAALSHSREAASSSARAQSASFFARLADQVSLRSFRSALRRVKNRSHASRKRFQVTLRVLPRDRADLLPFGLQLLQLVGGLDPVGRVGERFGALDERQLELEVGAALLGALREELARLGLNRVGGLAVAVPQRLRLRARRLGDLLPALLDLVQLVRGLLDVLGLRRVTSVVPSSFVTVVPRASTSRAAPRPWRSALPGRRRWRTASTRPSRAGRGASAP